MVYNASGIHTLCNQTLSVMKIIKPPKGMGDLCNSCLLSLFLKKVKQKIAQCLSHSNSQAIGVRNVSRCSPRPLAAILLQQTSFPKTRVY